MIRFGTDRARRKPNLTPMIDVVFLLLIFFMLASRFGIERAVPVTAAGAGGTYSGPPRLVDVAPGGVSLNGVQLEVEALAATLAPLMARPDDAIILRARSTADLQKLLAVMDQLSAAGFTRLVLVE